jgi:hypothetical protein
MLRALWRRRFWRRFLVAVLIAATADLVVRVASIEAINARLDSAQRAISYGLSSVSAWSFVRDAWHRLGDRHHYRVWTWRAPFNLTVVCREQRWSEFHESVARACVTGPWPDSTPPELRKHLPMRRVGTVDDVAYPRRAWLEWPLGLPDAAIFAVRCGWVGRASCEDPPEAPGASNWVGRTMLLAVLALAIWAAAPSRGSGWNPGLFVAAFAGGLVLTSLLAIGAQLLLAALSLIGLGVLKISSWVVAAAAFRPVVWVAAALKDVATDRATDVIASPPVARV